MRRRRSLTRLALLAIPALALTLAPAPMTVGLAHAQASDIKVPDPSVDRGMDRIILKDTSKVVEGRILEVTDARVHMEVIVAGISAERTFKRSNIVSIEFGTPVKEGAKADSTKRMDAEKKDEAPQVYDDTAKVYLMELEGFFGIHISETPLREAFEDVDETFDDLVWDSSARTEVVDPKVRDKHIVVIKLNNQSNDREIFESISRAESMYPILELERVRKGRRIVVWVEQARGGAIFLALSSPEIYFSSDATMFFGEDFDLQEFDTGDDMVDEKLISARLGHAIGAVNVGGYDDAALLVRAMVRSSNWLSVRYEGGEPILTDRAPPKGSFLTEEKEFWTDGEHEWEVLTDSGEGEFKDDEKQLFRNDLLGLDAGLAYKLGISKGRVDTIDDLLFELEIEDNSVVYDETEGQEVLDEWEEGIDWALDMISRETTQFGRPRGRLWREINDVKIEGEWKERNAARGKLISLHKQLISILTRYEEALDPGGAQRSQFRQIIDALKLAQQDDPKPVNRRGRRR